MAYLVKKPGKKQSIKSANADGPVTFEKFYDIVEESFKADLLDGKIIRKEYWIIDPLRRTIEFYENQDGEWVEIKPDVHGRLHSKVLTGLWLKTAWFAAHSLPPVLKVLQEILGKDQPLIQP